MRVGRSVILTAVLLMVFWFVLSRLHFVVIVPANLWQLLLAMGVVILVLFLGLDHLFNRTRR